MPRYILNIFICNIFIFTNFKNTFSYPVQLFHWLPGCLEVFYLVFKYFVIFKIFFSEFLNLDRNTSWSFFLVILIILKSLSMNFVTQLFSLFWLILSVYLFLHSFSLTYFHLQIQSEFLEGLIELGSILS